MAGHVEANSLSDITQLAANPPKYPRNPTEQKRQALTLYIARVPGTQDIILTTLKPQLKNVTAEDVASSLYYLHLNSESDAQYLDEEQDETSDAITSLPRQMPLPRKALPEGSRSSLDTSQTVPFTPVTFSERSKESTKRKPVAKEVSAKNDKLPAGSEQAANKRPLGPRPLLSEPIIGRKPLPGIENQKLGSDSQQPARNTSSGTPSIDGAIHEAPVLVKPQEQEEGVVQDPSTALTITIIRRDPSSGSQWNIGTIACHKSRVTERDSPPISPRRSKNPPVDMLVRLTTPGYSTFRHSHLANDVTDGVAGIKNSLQSNNSTGFDSSPSHRTSVPSYTFDRQIRMEGSDFWTRPTGQHKRTKSDISSEQGTTRGRSSSWTAAFGSAEPNRHGAPAKDSGPKGYMFLSPWGGRCKFSTSSSGRSLRLKHTLPAPVSAVMETESATPAQSSVSVSELRFNLPSSVVFNAVTSAVTRKSGVDPSRLSTKIGDLRNKLSSHKEQQAPPLPPRLPLDSYAAMYPSDQEDGPPLPPRPYAISVPTESSEDEVSQYRESSRQSSSIADPNASGISREESAQFDLSLGQEKAGGGNRGKRAKLGKLIIYDEGFKMLDLVVAANMSVWWSVWESDFR